MRKRIHNIAEKVLFYEFFQTDFQRIFGVFHMATVADLSDGSDIECDDYDDPMNLIGINLDEVVPRNGLGTTSDRSESDEWLNFFNEDQDYQEFEGFQQEWTTDDFTPRIPNHFNKVGGPTEMHPPEARPMHYFEQVWGGELWNIIVTETNHYVAQQQTLHPPPLHLHLSGKRLTHLQ